MWQLHKGCRSLLDRLVRSESLEAIAEYDVEDCFLNTSRDEVVRAVQYWLSAVPRRTRQQAWFAISKDCKAADHRGRSSSLHFWELSSALVLSVVKWELDENSCFEAIGRSEWLVLQQRKGLPIGGHLSASLVELVALFREYQPWPVCLDGLLTARYRDNFFVAFRRMPIDEEWQALAGTLTDMLGMPVKWVQCGKTIRVLELRVKLVLRSLLEGLAAKLRLCRVSGTAGYAASIRAAYQFVSARQYPRKLWVRKFALALLRNGVPLGCLPRLLRKAAGNRAGL